VSHSETKLGALLLTVAFLGGCGIVAIIFSLKLCAARTVYQQKVLPEVLRVQVTSNLVFTGMEKGNHYAFGRNNDELLIPPFANCGVNRSTEVGIIKPGVFILRGQGFDNRCERTAMFWTYDDNTKTRYEGDSVAIDNYLSLHYDIHLDAVHLVPCREFQVLLEK
jgi:hypothetical protein